MLCRTQTNDTAHAVKAMSTAVSDEIIHYTRSAQVKAHQNSVCGAGRGGGGGGGVLFCRVESLAPSVDSVQYCTIRHSFSQC